MQNEQKNSAHPPIHGRDIRLCTIIFFLILIVCPPSARADHTDCGRNYWGQIFTTTANSKADADAAKTTQQLEAESRIQAANQLISTMPDCTTAYNTTPGGQDVKTQALKDCALYYDKFYKDASSNVDAAFQLMQTSYTALIKAWWKSINRCMS